MIRFATFVDGSNFSYFLQKANIRVVDYEKFFHHLFELSVAKWQGRLFKISSSVVAMHARVRWYQLGSIDEIDLDDPGYLADLKRQFRKAVDINRNYMALAKAQEPTPAEGTIGEAGWGLFLQDARTNYAHWKNNVDQLRRWHREIESTTDGIDIKECGHWSISLLRAQAMEKQLDTTLAVDMIALAPTYEVALLISGDADSIPAVNLLKTMGKQVGVVDFIRGGPPTPKSAQLSRHLAAAADFVLKVYETEINKLGFTQGIPMDAKDCSNR